MLGKSPKSHLGPGPGLDLKCDFWMLQNGIKMGFGVKTLGCSRVQNILEIGCERDLGMWNWGGFE